jgi:hypothetical protein
MRRVEGDRDLGRDWNFCFWRMTLTHSTTCPDPPPLDSLAATFTLLRSCYSANTVHIVTLPRSMQSPEPDAVASLTGVRRANISA